MFYFDEKCQFQQLIYLAFFRVISVEAFSIISVNKIRKFYHGRSNNEASCVALHNETARLRSSPYIMLEKELYVFINSRIDLSIIFFNRQSLKAHANDLTDR